MYRAESLSGFETERVDRSLRKELLVIYSMVVLELAFATTGSPVIVTFNGLLIRTGASFIQRLGSSRFCVDRDLIITWGLQSSWLMTFRIFEDRRAREILRLLKPSRLESNTQTFLQF